MALHGWAAGGLQPGWRVVDLGGDTSYEWVVDSAELSEDRATVTVTMSHGKRTTTSTTASDDVVWVRR